MLHVQDPLFNLLTCNPVHYHCATTASSDAFRYSYTEIVYVCYQVGQLGIDAQQIEAYTKIFTMVEEASKQGPTDSS